MTNELDNKDINETQNPTTENYLKIKPEVKMSSKDVSDFWKDEFDKEKNYIANNKDALESKEVTDIQTIDVSELANDYIEDLKSKSECPETIPIEIINVNNLEVQSPEVVEEKREKFDNTKDKLIKEWETNNKREWPRYKNDVINSNGVVVRKAGDRYDAHHIIPLKLGGDNVSSNITPLDINSHKDVHSSEGSCNALLNNVKGGKE